MLKTNNAQIPAKNAVRVTANPVQVTFMAVFNHSALGVVKRAGFVDEIMAASFAIRQSKTIRARS